MRDDLEKPAVATSAWTPGTRVGRGPRRPAGEWTLKGLSLAVTFIGFVPVLIAISHTSMNGRASPIDRALFIVGGIITLIGFLGYAFYG